ncbi:MAG: hypothetical protein FJ297_12095 [Planctomycetes bacterium]|nr:hypothetical protein [Planctomycetota bacterium]
MGVRRMIAGAVLVAAGSTFSATVRAQSPGPLAEFAGEADDSLARRIEPGSDDSVLPRGVAPDAFVQRVRHQEKVDGDSRETTTIDPATGLVIVRTSRWHADRRLVELRTVVRNEGEREIELEEAAVADWRFRVLDGQDGARYRTLAYRNETWYGSTFWTGPDWTRVGKDWQHSGNGTPSVRRFRAPRAGHVIITGRAYKADTNGGDGVGLTIRHGARDVWRAEIAGDDAAGVEPRVELDLHEGDAVRFVVDKRGQITCDTTRWDPVIAYDDGERYQASGGFRACEEASRPARGDRAGNDSDLARGASSPWHYEMEVAPRESLGLPRIHTYARNLDLRDTPILAGESTEWTQRDAMPVLILADAEDKSGLVAVMPTDSPWMARSTIGRDGVWRFAWRSGEAGAPSVRVAPGESMRLPPVVVGAYRGNWLAGARRSNEILRADELDGMRATRDRLAESASWSAGSPRPHSGGQNGDAQRSTREPFEIDFWTMVLDDWRRQDKLDGPTSGAPREAARRHAGSARRLLTELRVRNGSDFLADEERRLEELEQRAAAEGSGTEANRGLYLAIRWLKRRIALANPLLNGPVVFCKNAPTSYSHQVMQYYGWRARPGGSLFVLEHPGHSLRTRDILDGRLQHGSILEPRLSYDARRIVFSFVDCPRLDYDPDTLDNSVDEAFYHVYEVGVDGTGFRQLTEGPYDDVMPTYLPDGGIAFCSSRRKGHSRCFGGQFSGRWQVYTLHRMDADGSNIRTLSYHDTNEWFPAVSNDGAILYSRWDYIDRDAVTHQNLWSTRIDGTNPVAVWGNATESPHCTFQIQPIPGSSKIAFTASAHHSITAGSIVVVDPARGDDGEQALRRITPEVPFPEAEGMDLREYYTAPSPLSEDFFLVAHSDKPLVFEPGANDPAALGIYLLDAFGNREFLYRDPNIGSTNPCLLQPRDMPPVVTSGLANDAPDTGVMTVVDVYEGLGDVPRGTIKELRIIQIFPKTTHVANAPLIGMAGEENARAILGTVPIEADGSAHFIVPARKPILFQTLDQDGFAYQTMRSLTYVQPGERTSCVGCHESRMIAPTRVDALAARRAPSIIEPGELGGRPFSFVEIVQPVLDRHCVACHDGESPDGGIDLTATPHGGFTRSYVALCGDRNFSGGGTNPVNAAEALVPRFGARNRIQTTPPGGMYGALGSRLIKILKVGHHDVRLTDGEYRRLAAWIDCNAVFYGVYHPDDQARQLRGEVFGMPDVQ